MPPPDVTGAIKIPLDFESEPDSKHCETLLSPGLFTDFCSFRLFVRFLSGGFCYFFHWCMLSKGTVTENQIVENITANNPKIFGNPPPPRARKKSQPKPFKGCLNIVTFHARGRQPGRQDNKARKGTCRQRTK